MLQLSTVDSNFFSFDPSNLCREATPVTPAVKRALKVMMYDMKVLHMLLG